MRKSLQILFVLLFFPFGTASAQPANIPYFCNFEDPAENARWIIPPSPTINKWVIGTATSSSPTRSAYISDNNGVAASYSPVVNALPFYREFNTLNEQYIVTFECKANGMEHWSDLRVYWVDNASIDISTWATTDYLVLDGNYYIYRKEVVSETTDWRQVSFVVRGNGSPAKLVFVWRNSFMSPNFPGGCVDNVRVEKLCPNTPTHIGIDTDNASYINLSWSGTGNSYDIRYRNVTEMSGWTTVYGKVPPDTMLSMTSLTNGEYEIQIGTDCNGETVWFIRKVFIYVAEDAADIPYFHDFEDDTENSKWQTNSVGINRWVIGTATSSSPAHSAYISNNNGADAIYSTTNGTTHFYREFNTIEGEQYLVNFDWKANGYRDFSDDLRAYWIDYPFVPTSQYDDGFLRTYLKNIIRGTVEWQSGSFVVTGNGLPSKLAFLWKSRLRGIPDPIYSPLLHYCYLYFDEQKSAPGGCVDNIEIVKLCPTPPTHIGVDTDGSSYINVSWSGTSDKYDVRYRNLLSTDLWTTEYGKLPPDTVLSLSSLPFGRYEVEIRANCGVSFSAWERRVFNIFGNNNCINFTDFYSPNVSAGYGQRDNPSEYTGVVDFRPEGMNAQGSRHTVHYRQDEYDVMTMYYKYREKALKTVPDGALASVRLGNHGSCSGNFGEPCGAEAITYTIPITEDYSVLLLNYAVVLQDIGHIASEQPYFKLEISDIYGNSIGDCGYGLFVPGTNTEDWDSIPDREIGSQTSAGIKWKDWTKLGVNLEEYIGQTIKVRLTTADCYYLVDFGYAYFTLACIKGRLDNVSCGGIPVTFTAPDGFTYKWYAEGNPDVILSTTNTFTSQPNDVNDYICRLEYIENENCFYTLKAYAKNRLPNAAADYMRDNCRNIISFQNQSYVSIHDSITQDEHLLSFNWNVSDGQTSTGKNPVFVFPDKAGTYTVHLVAGMSNGLCTDIAVFTISFPDVHLDTIIYDTICAGEIYNFNGKLIETLGVYTTAITNCYGCDSIVNLHLKVNETYNINIYDTICEGDTYNLYGFNESEGGFYTQPLQTVNGCDSIVNLELEVIEKIDVTLNKPPEVCADYEKFTLTFLSNSSNFPTHYQIIFNEKALKAGFFNQQGEIIGNEIVVQMTEKIYPDYYSLKIILNDSVYNCGKKLLETVVPVLYPTSIMEQKWDDVIVLLNEQNCGYKFVGYQWYQNGYLMAGETKSYIYRPLVFGDKYSVLITREDGSQMFSCPLEAKQPTQDCCAIPTVISPNGKIPLHDKTATVRLITTTGIVLSSYHSTNEITAPAQQGVYLLEISTGKIREEVVKIVVK